MQASNLNTLDAKKNKRFKCQRGDTKFLSTLIWSSSFFFMKSLVIHRSSLLASIWQRCTMFSYIFHSAVNRNIHSTFVRTCKCVSLCELQPPQSLAALMFCVFLEQNSHAEIKPTMNQFFADSKREEICSHSIDFWFDGPTKLLFWCASIFWLIALTAGS